MFLYVLCPKPNAEETTLFWGVFASSCALKRHKQAVVGHSQCQLLPKVSLVKASFDAVLGRGRSGREDPR